MLNIGSGNTILNIKINPKKKKKIILDLIKAIGDVARPLILPVLALIGIAL